MLGARGDVANLVVKDSLEDSRAGFVARPADPLERRGRDVEPARLEHHRDNRQARRRVVARLAMLAAAAEIRQLVERDEALEVKAANA